MIDTSAWKEFHLYDIFDIDMGNKMDKGKMPDGDIAFVGRTANNNGINARVGNVINHDKYGTVSPYNAGCITLALGGSIGSCFIQEEPFYTSQNVAVLIPKNKQSDSALRFVTSVITHSVLHGKYGAFTEELNKHIKTDFVIKLPATSDGQPDWVYMETYMKQIMEETEKSLENLKRDDDSKQQIDVHDWGEFKVGDLFDIHPTKAYKLTNASLLSENGVNPVIANSGFNNGIVGFSDFDCTEKAGVITFTDTAAKSSESFFYQIEDFIGYPHVQGMYCKVRNLNKYEGQFIATVMRNAAGKFDFIIKMTREEVSKFTIKLPITQTGEPDWQYMENYMKNIISTMQNNLTLFQAA